jgi:hypothetical protein
MYNLDFSALARQLLPTLLRKDRLVATATALLAPVRDLYAQLQPYQAQVRRELSYNAQVIMFEKALNDVFDSVLRRIRLDGGVVDRVPFYVRFEREQQPPRYTYSQAYAQANNLPPRYLRTASIYSFPVGFIVRVPLALVPADAEAARAFKAQIEAFILRLKLAATRHQTIYV